jgi:hypothetical protein
MREIPSLQVLSLRAVGSHSCSVEQTFCPAPDSAEPSQASKLLRSFHKRPVDNADAGNKGICSMNEIPVKRTPCIGPGSFRRVNANDVDLHHPIVGCRDLSTRLILQFGNPALDCLQSYVDSLVETGRMDDTRLGRHFFDEWKANVILGSGGTLHTEVAEVEPTPAPLASTRKRRRSSAAASAAAPAIVRSARSTPVPSTTIELGSLSLYNCTMSKDTVQAMVDAGMGPHLAVLDLTGVHGLGDDLLQLLLPQCVNLQRLSLKNCRRITVKSLRVVAQYQAKLESLDVGGAFNLTTDDVMEVVPTLTCLEEIHVSGLGWANGTLQRLADSRAWISLSLNFSLHISQAVLRTSLIRIAGSLKSLALAFCEDVVDNTLLGMLGRNLPVLQYLDVRGNPGLTTMTGWYDGRASADLPAQALLVLARYSGLSESSVDETKRVHLLAARALTAILDGNGMGAGIVRLHDANKNGQ